MSETKVCTHCKVERPLGAFSQKQSWCKPCMRDAARAKRGSARKKPPASHPWRASVVA